MKNRFLIFSILGVILLGILTFKATYCFMTIGETTEINFNTNGGNEINNIVYSYGLNSLTNRLPIPIKEGYTFDGWYLEKSYKTEIKNVPFPEFKTNNVITLYAKWNKKETTSKNNDLSSYIKYGIFTFILIITLLCVLLISRKKKSK